MFSALFCLSTKIVLKCVCFFFTPSKPLAKSFYLEKFKSAVKRGGLEKRNRSDKLFSGLEKTEPKRTAEINPFFKPK